MTEQEEKDLAEAKEEVIKLKISRMDYLTSMLRYTEQDFIHSGYRNGMSQAFESIIRGVQKDIDKIWAKHLKKYPD